MKNSWKQIFCSLFVLGCTVFLAACGDDENLNLENGYPVVSMGISIPGLEVPSSTVSMTGLYDNTGKLVLSDVLTPRTYEIKLDTPSPEDITVDIEPVLSNIPADKIVISDTKITFPAGYTTAKVTIGLVGDDIDFLRSDYEEKIYELGVRLGAVSNGKASLANTEVKTIVNKEAYVAGLSISGGEGAGNVSFTRQYWEGVSLSTEPIIHKFRAILDRPAQKDVKVNLTTSGIAEEYAGDVTITPSEIVIPAGEVSSPEITWTIKDDFVAASSGEANYVFALVAMPESDDPTVRIAENEANTIIFNIIKESNALAEITTELDSSWNVIDRSNWVAASDYNDANNAIDGKNSYLFCYRLGIDMIEEKEFIGMAIASNKWDIPTSFDIYISEVSTDREDWKTWSSMTDWTKIGVVNIGNATAATYYFRFVKPIKARYVRLHINGWKAMNEFYVYSE